jgi:hypothetical protein
MATRLINQTIWINKKFDNSSLIASILLHELTHIKDGILNGCGCFVLQTESFFESIHDLFSEI